MYFRYYVCYGQEKPERYSCPERLGFDVHNGVCDFPKQFDSNDIVVMQPSEPNDFQSNNEQNIYLS